MMTRTTRTTRAKPRFFLRKGKRCVSFDCQLLLPGAYAEGVVVTVVAVSSPTRGCLEAGLASIVGVGVGVVDKCEVAN
jgi:hypothetical protein